MYIEDLENEDLRDELESICKAISLHYNSTEGYMLPTTQHYKYTIIKEVLQHVIHIFESYQTGIIFIFRYIYIRYIIIYILLMCSYRYSSCYLDVINITIL